MFDEKIEDMYIDVKADINTTNQKCEKTFEEYARRIDLHELLLRILRCKWVN